MTGERLCAAVVAAASSEDAQLAMGGQSCSVKKGARACLGDRLRQTPLSRDKRFAWMPSHLVFHRLPLDSRRQSWGTLENKRVARESSSSFLCKDSIRSRQGPGWARLVQKTARREEEEREKRTKGST